jgi:hypothetical protein
VNCRWLYVEDLFMSQLQNTLPGERASTNQTATEELARIRVKNRTVLVLKFHQRASALLLRRKILPRQQQPRTLSILFLRRLLFQLKLNAVAGAETFQSCADLSC